MSVEMKKADNIVDARGLACPLPVVNTKKAIMDMHENCTVEVIVDNEIAVQNLKKFAAQKKYSVESTTAADNEFHVVITAGARKENEEVSCEQCEYGNNIEAGLLVVISGNVMGTGDEKLGKTLLKAFIFALTKQDKYPEKILLFNSGAFVSCEGSDSIEDLKYLEEQGVDIATCGTCLDFYGIKDKLCVGTVTNMYDIVEKMEKAVKTVRI